jgi:hypothetical protein
VYIDEYNHNNNNKNKNKYNNGDESENKVALWYLTATRSLLSMLEQVNANHCCVYVFFNIEREGDELYRSLDYFYNLLFFFFFFFFLPTSSYDK